MKVGKPKSKRVPVRLRHKIEKASAAKQRKQRKEAKKNPQWRSRLKKDPGIPNLFPYKAQVLAEIEESKQKREEEAQRRRAVAKAQRQGTAAAVVDGPDVVDNVIDDDEVLLDEQEEVEDEDTMDQDDSNPVAALLESAQARAQVLDEADDADSNEDDDDGEWGGIEDSSKKAPNEQKALPKQAIADPIKAVSALIDRMQKTTDGIQRLLDYYQAPPLVTAGTDATTSFLVQVARKRGRLGKGGVPNLHSAALTVLSDLNEERLQLPAAATVLKTKANDRSGKGEVQLVTKMAEPFRIEGLWGDLDGGGVATEERMVVET
ncbi:nuclear GTP-binding protein nug1 [Vermiconidia calcicola]|uniref:Nuclear GTP-binding protein nug1 n=1 Tax=Vermiconidia calcicola TaxID=1690605 RepID=A0ACC3MEK6_9PEZI|nr:nuclear GTP-binding protein nug1 [Vermiconidia calcicola]